MSIQENYVQAAVSGMRFGLPAPADLELRNEAILQATEKLYNAGLNVFPIQPRSKVPYGSQSILITTRLHRSRLAAIVCNSNIAVMAGNLSQGLFILDCDSSDDFDYVGKCLQERGIHAWVRNSICGGQYWLLCADGEVKNTKIRKIDVIGNRKYSVAPPSIHPRGMTYEWICREGDLPPLVTLGQLNFLSLEPKTRKHSRGSYNRGNLPPVAKRVLVDRDISGYESNSEAEYAACWSMISTGFADTDIIAIFADHHPPHYCKQGEQNFIQYVLMSARVHLNNVTHPSEGATNSDSTRYKDWAEGRSWPGRTGTSDKGLYLALCERLQMSGTMPFRGSVREVAELAGCNKETAANGLERLKMQKLIHPSGYDNVTKATLWSFQQHPDDQDPKPDLIRTVGKAYGSVGNTVRIKSGSHDIWHRNALGKSAYECWMKLLENPAMTQTHISKLTGRVTRTISRALSRLESHGLVTEVDKKWHAHGISDEAVSRVVAYYRTMGRADQRVQKHRQERELNASRLLQAQKQVWGG